MQENIHPPYHNLKLKIGKDVFETKSTLGGELLVEIDYRLHRAWSKDKSSSVNQSNKTIGDFNKKYGNLFGAKKSTTV